MSKKVLITGGTGLVGSHLTEKLLAQGFAVNYLSRTPSKTSRIKAYEWDPAKGIFDDEALRDVEYIVNLAGAGVADKKWSAQRKKVILESRTKSTAFLRDQLKKGNHSVKTFISASAIGFYGWDNGSRWQKENSRFGDDFLATVTKAWEEEAKLYRELNIRTVLLRLGVVLSTEGGALPKITMPIKLGAGAALGSGDQYMSWIHIDDVAGIIGFCINEDRIEDTFNVVAPNPVTNKEFTKIAAKKLRRPLILPNVPAFILRLMLGEMATTVLGSCRASAEKITEAGYSFHYEKADEALQNLLTKG